MLSWVKWALSFCALGLFAAGAFICAAKLVRPPAAFPARGRAARREILLAALAFLLFAVLVQGTVVLCAVRQSPGAGLESALGQFFGGIDAPHYISLARYGYQNEWNETVAEQHLRIVFFPLFPWLLRALNVFGALPWYAPWLCRAAAAVCVLRRRAVCPCGRTLRPAYSGAGVRVAFGLSGRVFLCFAHDGKPVSAFVP